MTPLCPTSFLLKIQSITLLFSSDKTPLRFLVSISENTVFFCIWVLHVATPGQPRVAGQRFCQSLPIKIGTSCKNDTFPGTKNGGGVLGLDPEPNPVSDSHCAFAN